MMLYLERPYVKVHWNDAFQCVETEWLGFAFGDPYREVLDAVLELHRRKNCPKNLADMRQAAVIVEEDARWLLNDWMPRARAAGVVWFAVVAPASVIGQMQLDQIGRKGGRKRNDALGMETLFFKDPDEARRWLRQQPQGR